MLLYTVDSLLERYQEKIILVDEKKEKLDVLKDFVGIKELDSNLIPPQQMEIFIQNIKSYEDYNGLPIKFHFYEVVRNNKSEIYYEELKQTQSLQHIIYFDKPTVFIVFEENFGLEETNSNRLFRDYVLLRGVTKHDLQEKNQYLFHYLSYISAWEESKEWH